MLILGIDTTTLACSVALLRDDTILAELTLNIKKTHSERLMPLLDHMLQEAGLEREEIDAVAVAAGPGSFTGLRIGVSTARALAQGLQIPAVPVCTLGALAESIFAPGTMICPLLDARRNQVYTALFHRQAEPPCTLETIIEPAPLALDELTEKLSVFNRPVVFVGEGLSSYAAALTEGLPGRALISPAPFRHCRAALTALKGRRLLENNPNAAYEDLLPIYLRQPEAERLAAERQGGSNQ
jgi:tRNA threonylcarbamoyladenosine biosynthesis protein TsaB